MYPVSESYKNAIWGNNQEFSCDITIEHSQGTLELTDEDLSMGSLTYTEATQSGEEYTIGSTVASDISFTIFNKPAYTNLQLMGATVFVNIGLHINQSTWEYVPLGRFNIDVVDKTDSTIQIKAMDNMINFDKPYTLSNLSYPATLQQIYVNVCSLANVSAGTIDFPNKNYTVTNRPSGDLTLRDILGYVAELSGTFAKCTRTGRVELRWYEPTDLEITPDIRYDFTPSDDLVQITGVMATVKGEDEEDDVVYTTGTDTYIVDISGNALLQGGYSTVLPNIFNNIKDTSFTPYTSNTRGNPTIQAGDIIKQIDKNGKEYTTIITRTVYKYRGKSSINGSGLSQISKGYKGSTNRKIAEIRRILEDSFNREINEMEQAIADGMIITYYQELEPDGKLGDLWFDSVTGVLKRYDGFQWTLITDQRIIDAISMANDAQTTADGKIVTFYDANEPTNGSLGDLWIDLNDSNRLYRFDGTNWIDIQDGAIDKISQDLADALTNINSDLSDLELAILNATELITGQMGGHVLKREGELLIMDNPDPNLAVKVWRWNLGGLGYSSTGVDGIYEIAMTMDGSINANFITTGYLSADIIQSGLLQSQDGSTSINLNTGAFNFKDQIKWNPTTNKVELGSGVTLNWENLDEDAQQNLKGNDGKDGEDGKDGKDGYTPVKGTDYFDGVDGQDGKDGESRYLWIRYSQNSNGNPFVTDPTDAKYIGIATTETDSPPSNYLSYSWSLIKGTDGIVGEDGEDGQTSYLHIKYSDNGTSFTSNNGETVGAYIGTYVDFEEEDSMVFSKYTWNKVKGDKGEDGYTPVKGADYFDGEDGQDGESKYLWIKYSQNSNGNPATDNPTNAKYIGIATTITNVKPSHYLSYTWSLIKGEDGVKGETGPNGQTSYLHIKYSNNGTTFTSNGGKTVGSWIGTYVDFVEADSTVFSRYTWNKVKGEDGSDANVPDYIKPDEITSTKITNASIESPTIIGGTITGGSITSNSTINVSTNAYIGNNLYLGSQSISSAKSIAFNDRTAITGVGRGINSKLDLSAYKVDISSVYVDINASTTTIHYDLNIGEVGKIYFDSGGSINFNNASVLNFSGNDISKGTVPYARLPSDNLVHSSGSNARGKWIRYGNGVQICWYNTILTYTSTTTIDNSWTYPIAFIDPPAISGNATNTATVVHRSLAIYFTSVTRSSCTALMSRPTGSTNFATSDTRNVSFMAIGMWK